MKKGLNMTEEDIMLLQSIKKTEKSQHIQNKIELQIEEIMKTESLTLRFLDVLAAQQDMLAQLKNELKTVFSDDKINSYDINVQENAPEAVFISDDDDMQHAESTGTGTGDPERKTPHEIAQDNTQEVIQISHSEKADSESSESDNLMSTNEREPCQVVLKDSQNTLSQAGRMGKGMNRLEVPEGADMAGTRTEKIDLDMMNASFTIRSVTQAELEQAGHQMRGLISNNILNFTRLLKRKLTLAQGIFIWRAVREGAIKPNKEIKIRAFQRRLCVLLGEIEDQKNATRAHTIPIRVQSESGSGATILITRWRTVRYLMGIAKEILGISCETKLLLDLKRLIDQRLICEEGLADNQVVTIIEQKPKKIKRR